MNAVSFRRTPVVPTALGAAEVPDPLVPEDTLFRHLR